MDKSLIVQGKSLEEALNKAGALLCCAREAVAYEVLRDPKPGRYGQPGIPCKLRVMSVDMVAEAATAAPEANKSSEIPMPWTVDELAAFSSAAFLQSLHGITLPAHEDIPAPAVCLQPCREIRGTLGPGPVEIAHDGDITISGSVLKGATVTASGSIHVAGNVEAAGLDAGGDISVEGGVLGRITSTGGSVSCRFAQGAQISAALGDILVQESAMHAQLHAGHKVRIGDILLGGNCYGENLVEARIAGSESGIPTTIITGHNKRLMDEAESIRQQALEIHHKLTEDKQKMILLIRREQRAGPLPAAERVRLWQTAARITHSENALWQLAGQKSHVLGMINADKGARICVRERVFVKVKIIADDAPLAINSITQFVSFSKDYETGIVRVTSFQ